MLYLLLSAEFVAAAQVLVYAGAVMVMFLFVIAYLGGRADAPWAGGPSWQSGRRRRRRGGDPRRGDRRDRAEGRAGASRSRPRSRRTFGSPAEIGRLFLTDHLLAFEITSIVLLVAAVGGVILGSHSRRRSRGGDAEHVMRVPDVAWYLGGRPRFLFATGALGVLHAPQPADRAALARDHAQRRRTSP